MTSSGSVMPADSSLRLKSGTGRSNTRRITRAALVLQLSPPFGPHRLQLRVPELLVRVAWLGTEDVCIALGHGRHPTDGRSTLPTVQSTSVSSGLQRSSRQTSVSQDARCRS